MHLIYQQITLGLILNMVLCDSEYHLSEDYMRLAIYQREEECIVYAMGE